MPGLLFLFVDPFLLPSGIRKGLPISGVSSERIALEADAAAFRGFQPVRCCLEEQFCCSLPGCGV